MAKIEMYVWDDCAYCKRAREVLARNGVDMTGPDYIEHDITQNKEGREALRVRMGVTSTVVAPQVFINDRYLGCCADLLDLELDGKIAARLNGEFEEDN